MEIVNAKLIKAHAAWHEEEHPRDERGRFTDKDSGNRFTDKDSGGSKSLAYVDYDFDHPLPHDEDADYVEEEIVAVEEVYDQWRRQGSVHFPDDMGYVQYPHFAVDHWPDEELVLGFSDEERRYYEDDDIIFEEHEEEFLDWAYENFEPDNDNIFTDQELEELKADFIEEHRQSFMEYKREQLREQAQDFLGYVDANITGITVDGKYQGLMNYTFQPMINALEINYLETAPQNRGHSAKYKGVGTTLLARAVEISRENGSGAIILTSAHDAVGFYEKIGMERIQGYKYYFKAEDALRFLERAKAEGLYKSLDAIESLADLEAEYGILIGKRNEDEDEEPMEKGIGAEMLQKYPGGKWVTMHGRHVYIKEDGEVAPETDPNKGNTAKDKAKRLYDKPHSEIKEGEMYKHGNTTVTVEKKGRKYLHVKDTKGNVKQIPKTKFAAEGDASASAATGAEVSGQEQQVAPKAAKDTKTAQTAKPVAEGMGGEQPGKLPDKAADKGTGTGEGSQTTGAAVKSLFKETERLSGTGSTDKLEEIYAEWSKHGHTYFDKSFPQAWFGVELAQEKGNPAADNHTARVLKDSKGQPAGVSYTVAQDDHVYIQYAEVAPQHRAESKNKNREKGLGTKLIAEAVQESIDRGFGGKIRLLSLSRDEAQGFYRKLGMKNIGGLHYEMDAKTAQRFLAAVKAKFKAYDIDEEMPLAKALKEDLDWEAILAAEDKLKGFVTGPVQDFVDGTLKTHGKRPELLRAD